MRDERGEVKREDGGRDPRRSTSETRDAMRGTWHVERERDVPRERKRDCTRLVRVLIYVTRTRQIMRAQTLPLSEVRRLKKKRSESDRHCEWSLITVFGHRCPGVITDTRESERVRMSDSSKSNTVYIYSLYSWRDWATCSNRYSSGVSVTR